MDVVIFGGGAAGLWLLDELHRRGTRVVLLEANSLCAGQTIAAQGIIHGGLKYSLQGLLTKSAAAIREMPVIWRECLSGQREPNLSRVQRRSDDCFLWRTDSWSSRLGMLGAHFGLRVAPESVSADDRPDVLRGVPGSVARLPEQVISPRSFAEVFAERHATRLLKVDADAVQFVCESPAHVSEIRVQSQDSRQPLMLRPRWIVFAAGLGNVTLRQSVGLKERAMQRRPLHMVMVRGDLPLFQGHCVDGAKTRVTISSERDSAQRVVWQVGGQIAENGVAWDELTLLRHARQELEAVLPHGDFSLTEWASYRVDRAEGQMADGQRPETVQIRHEGNCLTAWPTKLALVPQLTAELCQVMEQHGGIGHPNSTESLDDALRSWPRPTVALPPWETAARWWSSQELSNTATTPIALPARAA